VQKALETIKYTTRYANSANIFPSKMTKQELTWRNAIDCV